MSAQKKLMMTFEPLLVSGNRRGTNSRRSSSRIVLPSSLSIQRESRIGREFTNSEMARKGEKKISEMGKRQVKREERISSKFSHSTSASLKVMYNLVIFLAVLMNSARSVESVPAGTGEQLDSKIKMFLDSHCTMQNQTLEQEEYESFMSCGPTHGAGIVKNLGQIPEYKSDDTEQWSRASKRVIISQCDVWSQNRTCQETTFKLIEKCFGDDQKLIFYFMFSLTDAICQTDNDMFIKFWQNGGDSCLGNHLKSLKKDFSDCFEKTSTISSADVYRNFDDVMQCFRSQFDNDCIGEGANEVLAEIMAEIKRVYRETSKNSASNLQTIHFPVIILLASWMTFLR